MEPVENPMVMPEYEYKSNRMPDDVWAEREDRDYEDSIFEVEFHKISKNFKEENKND